jgi:enoyl-[acyl-carrier protein] reductase II
MLHTPFCDLVGIEAPIVQAPAAPYVTPELVAAVSNAGGLGSFPTGLLELTQIKQDIGRIRELTDRPFAINFLMESFDPEAFEFVMNDPPAVVSFAAALPAPLIERARAGGARVFVQVQKVEQALQAVEIGVDAVIAQGTEAGGLTGEVSLMPLLPQIVDAVSPIPVIAAGGIADGRGLAAALALGAQGVNVGTRFLATDEARMDARRRDDLLQSTSNDTVLATIFNRIFPSDEDAFPLTLRSLRTPFLDRWEGNAPPSPDELDALRDEVIAAIGAGKMHEFAAGAGESVGLIHDIAPAAEILQRMLIEAESALDNASRWVVRAV